MKRYKWEDAIYSRILEEKAGENGEKVFVYFENQKITYQDIDRVSNAVANSLIELGIRKGEKVALMMQNHPNFIYSWFAVAKIGAALVPINIALKGEGLAYILNHSDAEYLITGYELFDRFRFLEKEGKLKKLKRIILDLTEVKEEMQIPDALSFGDLTKNSQDMPKVDLKADDLMEIMYTSGTTGPPKGVMMEQARCLSGLHYADLMHYTPDDRLYVILPLFHGNAQYVSVWSAILANASIVLARCFSVSRFWDDTRRYNVSEFNSLGSIIPMLYKQPEKENDSDNPVRATLSAGCPKEIWRDFERRFNLTIVEWYGAVDSGSTFNTFGGKVGSIGKPAPHYWVKIINEKGEETVPNEVGEIITKPKNPLGIGVRYYKDPIATAEKVKDGWAHSGDLAYRDEEGWIYFARRKKDCIRRRGENISVYEIESVVSGHPKILECAAISVPSEVGEDEVKLCVVLKPGEALSYEDFIAYCEERMAYYMVPRYVEYLDTLPKTETQKIQKYKLGQAALNDNTWDREMAGYKLKR